MIDDLPVPYNRPLTQEIREALGSLTIEYATLDMDIKFMIWVLLCTDVEAVGKRVTMRRSAEQLLDLLEWLVKLRIERADLRVRFASLQKTIRGLESQRNEFIHSFWVSRPRKEEALNIRIDSERGEFFEEGKSIDPAELWALARDFENARTDLMDLRYAIENSLPQIRHTWYHT